MNGHKTGKGSRGPRGRGVITRGERSGLGGSTSQGNDDSEPTGYYTRWFQKRKEIKERQKKGYPEGLHGELLKALDVACGVDWGDITAWKHDQLVEIVNQHFKEHPCEEVKEERHE